MLSNPSLYGWYGICSKQQRLHLAFRATHSTEAVPVISFLQPIGIESLILILLDLIAPIDNTYFHGLT